MKIGLYTVFLLLTFVFQLNAQEWVWAIRAGGSGDDFGYSLATDQEGNTYIAGSFESATLVLGDSVHVNQGLADILIFKLNREGEILWSKTFGGPLNDNGYAIAVDPAGNICLTGVFESDLLDFGIDVLMNRGLTDVFLAKFDALGNVLWVKSVGGPQADETYSISTDMAGQIFISGQFVSDSLHFENQSLVNSSTGFSEIFLAKFDASGHLLWATNPTGTHHDIAYGVATDLNGNAYIAGFFRSLTIHFDAMLLLNTSQARDMFLAKYSPDGDVLWVKKAGGDQNDLANAVNWISEDEIYVSGAFRSDSIILGNTVLHNHQSGFLDFFTARFNGDGQLLSAQGGGGNYEETVYCVSGEAGSNRIVAGTFQSAFMDLNGFPLMNHSDSIYDMFFVQYDSDNNVTWTENIGGPDNDYVFWIATDHDQNHIATGIFRSDTLQVGDTTLISEGGVDIFIAKLTTMEVGVMDLVTRLSPVSIYPNPAHDVVTVLMEEDDRKAVMDVYNPLGQRLTRKYFQHQTELRNGQDFDFIEGIYLLLIRAGNDVFAEKMIVH